MSLIFANWFKPQSEEATEGEGGATSSSTRAASGASSSSSVHVDGWRLPRPSEGVRSRRASRDLHAWPAPTPTPHTPSLLHRSGGLPRLLTTVRTPTDTRAPQPQGQVQRPRLSLACAYISPSACVSRADQHLSCRNPSPAPAPAPAPALSFSRPPGGDAALLALHPAADGRLDTEPLRDVRLATALLDPRARCARMHTVAPVHALLHAQASAHGIDRHAATTPRCNHATLQPRAQERERACLRPQAEEAVTLRTPLPYASEPATACSWMCALCSSCS